MTQLIAPNQQMQTHARFMRAHNKIKKKNRTEEKLNRGESTISFNTTNNNK